MIAVEKRELVGRTYEEDDDEGLGAPIVKHFDVKFETGAVPAVETLLVGLDIVSLAFVPVFTEAFNFQAIGVVSANDEVYHRLLYGVDSKVLFLVHVKSVDSDDATSWLKAIMNISPRFVVGLGSLSTSQFFGRREAEYFLRHLISAPSSSKWSQFDNTLQKIRSLEPGNVVTGVAAAILSYCEAREVPSVLLLTVTSASLSLGSIKVFEQVWPFFERLGSGSVRKCTNKEYSLAIKANTFVSTTENMYC